MFKSRVIYIALLVVLILATVSCGPAATPTPVTIVQTVLAPTSEPITKVETKVVQETKIVEKVVEVSPTPLKEVTLQVWHQGEGSFENAQKIFEKLYPNIKIKATVYAPADMIPALTAALQAGTGPDVIYYDASKAYLGAVVEAGYALDLTEFAVHKGWDQKMFKYAQKLTTYNGKLYGVGGFTEIVGIFYNADLFTKYGLEPPTTWEKMVVAAERAKKEGLLPFAQGALENYGAVQYCGCILHAMVPYDILAGAEFLDGKGSWSDPKMIAGAAECQNWVLKYGYFPKDIDGISVNDAVNDFIGGRSLMHIDGSWAVDQLRKANFKVEFARFSEKDPTMPTQNQGGISSTWFVNKATNNLDAVLTFLDFFVFSDIANTIWVKENALTPSVEFDVKGAGADPLQIQMIDSVAYSSKNGVGITAIWPGFVSDPSFINAEAAAWQALFANKLTPEEMGINLAKVQDDARKARGVKP